MHIGDLPASEFPSCIDDGCKSQCFCEKSGRSKKALYRLSLILALKSIVNKAPSVFDNKTKSVQPVHLDAPY